jgi:hypothetical protein
MNVFEKFAAKRFLTEALFYKVAQLPPAQQNAIRGRAASAFAEMDAMPKPKPLPQNPKKTTTSTGTMKVPPIGGPKPGNPHAATPAIKSPNQPIKRPVPQSNPNVLDTAAKGLKKIPSAMERMKRRPAKTTVMQGSTGANVKGGFAFDRKAAQADYIKKRGTYSKNPSMDRTIHFSRARRAALKAHHAKQQGQ